MVCVSVPGVSHIQECSTLGHAVTDSPLTPYTWFECVSMLVILLNCVTLGMYQPCDDMECLSDRCKILQVSLSVVSALPPNWCSLPGSGLHCSTAPHLS